MKETVRSAPRLQFTDEELIAFANEEYALYDLGLCRNDEGKIVLWIILVIFLKPARQL